MGERQNKPKASLAVVHDEQTVFGTIGSRILGHGQDRLVDYGEVEKVERVTGIQSRTSQNSSGANAVKQLPEGTIFRFTNPDARDSKFVEGRWDQLCVALFDAEMHCCDGNYRRLSCTHSHAGQVKALPLESIEIVGLMPKDKAGAVSWDDSFAFPHGLKPGTVIQFNTKPSWWTCEDWRERVVVMFRSPSTEDWIRIRRMAATCPYQSMWSLTDEDFDIVGLLAPDQLYVTDSMVGLKPDEPEVNEEGVDVDETPVVDPRFTEGTVFRFTGSPPKWWVAEPDEWSQPCVVVDLSSSHNGAVPFRRLPEICIFDSFHFFPEVDEFEIIGQLPEGKRDSTKMRDVRNTQFVERQVELTIGTKFRFNKIPERWRADTNAKVGDLFFVIEDCRFNGKGQCIGRDEPKPVWWHPYDGVLPTDDIEILEDKPAQQDDQHPVKTSTWGGWAIEQSSGGWSARREDGTYVCGEDLSVVMEAVTKRLKHHQKQEVERLTMKIQELEKEKDSWLTADDLHARIASLSKENGELLAVNWKSTAEDLKREMLMTRENYEAECRHHNKLVESHKKLEKYRDELEKENGQLKGSLSDWMASYDEAHRTIKKLSEKQPNAAIAFMKRIW